MISNVTYANGCLRGDQLGDYLYYKIDQVVGRMVSRNNLEKKKKVRTTQEMIGSKKINK